MTADEAAKTAKDLKRKAARTADQLKTTASVAADALKTGKTPSRWDRPITITRKQAFLFLVALSISILLDCGIGTAQYLTNKANNKTQTSLRQTQISIVKGAREQCLLDAKRAAGQREYQKFVLATQEKGLEEIKHLPQFNTPEIRKLAEENQQQQIDATNRLVAAYAPPKDSDNCSAFKLKK